MNDAAAVAPSRRRTSTPEHRASRFDRSPSARFLVPATDGDIGPDPDRSGRRNAGPAAAALEGMRSMVICDDRVEVRRELSCLLRGRSQDSVVGVADGAALLDAYHEGPARQVLVGIHSASTVGREAINLLRGAHPTAAPVVFGALTDIDLLADAYVLGAGGLLLWESGNGRP